MSCSTCLQIVPDTPSNICRDTCVINKSTFFVSTKIPIRCWGCDTGIGYNNANTINHHKPQYIVQPTSLYTEDKSSLVVYKNPTPSFFNVNWNQSSDRPIPHKQITNIQRNTSSLIGTRTGSKPGSMSPGGVGVDIKHNSFYRYNLRLRGGVLKTNKCCEK